MTNSDKNHHTTNPQLTHTEETHTASRGARDVQQIIDYELARVGPAVRRELLCAVQEHVTQRIAAMDENARLNAKLASERTAKEELKFQLAKIADEWTPPAGMEGA